MIQFLLTISGGLQYKKFFVNININTIISDDNNRITEMWQKWNYGFAITKIKNCAFCQSAFDEALCS